MVLHRWEISGWQVLCEGSKNSPWLCAGQRARYVDLSYRDQDTPVITYDEKWQNARQKVKVTVLKKEKDTERVLAGGVFGLYTSEDIKNAKGEVLLEKDSLIEQRVTDEKGQITFTADLPVDGKY